MAFSSNSRTSRKLVQTFPKVLKASRLKMVEISAEERERLERVLQSQQVAGVGGFERHLAQQALEVLHAAHRPPKFFPLDGGFQELLDHIQPRLELARGRGRGGASRPSTCARPARSHTHPGFPAEWRRAIPRRRVRAIPGCAGWRDRGSESPVAGRSGFRPGAKATPAAFHARSGERPRRPPRPAHGLPGRSPPASPRGNDRATGGRRILRRIPSRQEAFG